MHTRCKLVHISNSFCVALPASWYAILCVLSASSEGQAAPAAPGQQAGPGDSDSNEEADIQQIDEARERALDTARREKTKRLRERMCRWICGNVLSEEVIREDELESSVLLSVLKTSEAFAAAAAIEVKDAGAIADTRAPAHAGSGGHSHSSSRSAQEECGGKGGARGKGVAQGRGTWSLDDCIREYKSAIADLLVLEKDLLQWYGRRSDALLEEVGKRLVDKFSSEAGESETSALSSGDECMSGSWG